MPSLKSLNPSTGEKIEEIPISTEEELKKAVSRARKTFPEWRDRPLKERIDLLKDVKNAIQKEKEEITDLIHREMGKPKPEARGEVSGIISRIDFYSQKARELKDIQLKSYPESRLTFVPHGVLGLITPWNFPFSVPLGTIIPALLTGNTIVFKPSEYTSLVGRKIHRLLNQVLPSGVLNTVYGADETGKELVKSDINKLFFTGSVGAGKHIRKNIGLKPASMELGGKDPAIVREDVDLDYASSGLVWGSLRNCGQVCCSIERIYAHESIIDELVQKMLEHTENLKLGKDIGPLVSEQQLEKVESHIEDAVSSGANLLTGGKRPDKKGFWFQPTLITDLNHQMKIMKEETFGPVISVMPVENDEEALKLANDTPYGLAASVWTSDLDKAEEMASKIDTGTVWLNNVMASPTACSPYWGGTKNSGLRETEGLLKQCLKAKVIVKYTGQEKGNWFPY